MKLKHLLFGAIAIVSSLLISSSSCKLSTSPAAGVTQAHPLPTFLERLPSNDQGDYFDLIEITPVGYLIWSQFPVTIYVEPLAKAAGNHQENTAEQVRQQQWLTAVETAIQEWHQYLPIEQTEDSKSANIAILRLPVERKIKLDPETGLYDIPRAITAQTTYQIYLSQPEQILAHQMKLQISPDLSPTATLSAARHELGHALGIWGHSDRTTDALYFSQVRDTPTISSRDLNTLKKIYQQPTKLGWQIN